MMIPCVLMSGIEKYVYSLQDLDVSRVVTWENGSSQSCSAFDKHLLQVWNEAMNDGDIFRYTLEKVVTRVVPGKIKFVAQLNPMRAAERRPAETITSLNTPLDPTKFNFTRIPQKEILFHLSPQQSQTGSEDTSTSSGEQPPPGHQWPGSLPLLVNVSPLSEGHVLIAPDVEHLLPQRLTPNAIRIGLELVCLSAHSGFLVGFNSLCALASVNHLHIHAWYCPEPLYAQTATCSELCPGLYEMDVLTPGFVLPLHDYSPEQITRHVFAITSHLQNNDIAHNVVICHGTSLLPSEKLRTTPRIIIYPRRQFTNVKIFQAFNVALAELAGQIPYYFVDRFHDVTEEEIASVIREQALPDEEYKTLQQQVIQIYKDATGTK